MQATNQSTGTRKSNSKLRSWWDKDIDKCTKEHNDASKRHRQWCEASTP